ncbi:MAG: cupin-like domain-containing protein, partial [Pseudoxanthomonas sp.]
MLAVDNKIRELTGLDPRALPDEVLQSSEPAVLRGIAADWPVTRAAKESAQAAVTYLRGFERKEAQPVVALVGPPEIEGRFFYNAGLDDFNFRRENVPMGVALNTLLKYASDPNPPAIYIGSTTIDT